MNIGEGSHPENVKVYGPGVEKTGLKANEPTYFTVDCSEAGQGQPVQLIVYLTVIFFHLFSFKVSFTGTICMIHY